jgi:hypothetical protein
MCGLCGSLQGGAHWSDAAPPAADAEVMPSWQRRALRRMRVAAANRLLAPCGLALADWQGARFMLRSRTGGTADIVGFGDLWPQVDRLCAAPPDPLDYSFLDQIKRRNG